NQVSYFDPETIDVKILPIMGGRRLALADAPIDSVTFAHRGIRPYPPGNVMIFDALTSSSSSDAFISGDITVSWSHRNRLDNPDILVFQSDGDIGPEPGTTYNVRLYDGAILLASATGLTGTTYNFAPVPSGISDAFIEVESVRDGYISWQFHRVPFVYIGGSSSGA
ncbi:MAG: hypothetical protein ACRESZ_10835, partial [Methylococcales bacterium]